MKCEYAPDGECNKFFTSSLCQQQVCEKCGLPVPNVIGSGTMSWICGCGNETIIALQNDNTEILYTHGTACSGNTILTTIG